MSQDVDTHIDLEAVRELVQDVIQRYREEYGYLNGSGMSSRDEHNLTKRLTRAVSSKLDEIDTDYVEYLEDRVAELEKRDKLGSDQQFTELYHEYEGMRALAKELIYRLGKEDSVLVIPNDQLQYKADNVDLDVRTEEVVTKVEVTEFDS